MNCQFLRITQFVVLCWTASIPRAQQMSDRQTSKASNGNLESSYFFYHRPEYPRDCDEIRDQCSSDISSGVYLIKPDGYPEAFEVYCENADSQLWTVILRRTDGSVDFDRIWIDYKVGFGFLSHEVWIGNEKLSYLTNQKKYELVINMTNADGVSCSISYDVFRVSDEFGKYTLTSLGEYSGNADDCFSICPNNMEHTNCSCQRTCGDPLNCVETCTEDAKCVCPRGFYLKGKACVPPEECGCYVAESKSIVHEGGFYVSTNCTRRGDCNNGQLSWNDTYRCSTDAVCEERDNVHQCYCKAGFTGNGIVCTPSVIYRDCKEIYDSGVEDSGIYTISPASWSGSPFEVYCNMTDGGGWTTFQRRVDGNVDFYRNWISYKEGFGSPDDEHWLGNEKLYYLTNQKRYTIRIDLVNRYGSPYYAKFDFFRINDESDKYRLSEVGSYSGTADSRGSSHSSAGFALHHHRNYQFSTYDQDNDASVDNCARRRHGAWWYNDCAVSNLNGDYNSTSCYTTDIYWDYLPGHVCFIKFTEMKIRPFS